MMWFNVRPFRKKSVKMYRKDTQPNKNVPDGLFRNVSKINEAGRNTVQTPNALKYQEKFVDLEPNKLQAMRSALTDLKQLFRRLVVFM